MSKSSSCCVERGADINAKDTFYNATPLTWAVNPAMDRTPQHAEVVRRCSCSAARRGKNRR